MSYDLPPVIRELERAIGLVLAMRLVDKYGGTKVYVPKSAELGGEHPLVELLGADAARALTEDRGGEWLGVPRCAAMLRGRRDREVLSRYERDGKSARAIALEFQVTERTVWRILGRSDLTSGDEAEVSSRQLELPGLR